MAARSGAATKKQAGGNAPEPRPARKKPKDPLGRLKSLGLKQPWQVALLLPKAWDDFSRPLRNFDQPILEGCGYAIEASLDGFELRFTGTPRISGYLRDQAGRRLGFTVFGDTRDLQQQLREIQHQGPQLFYGRMGGFNGRPWLDSLEIVNRWWEGRQRPVYSGKTGVIGPELVRGRVLAGLREAVPLAATWIAEQLRDFGSESDLLSLAGAPGETLQSLLLQAHLPDDQEQGEQAQQVLELIASLGIIRAAKGNLDQGKARAFVPGDYRERVRAIPFALTAEQLQAINEICADLGQHRPMRRILTGDVGSGKTCVFGSVCAAVADGQGKSIILLPNYGLACQVARELSGYWPDLAIQTVTADADAIDPASDILVGTTALLHRQLPWQPDLVVVDEQQKFSREQREQMVGPNTNLLESTATCIPRTMALARYGVVNVSKLTGSHCDKQISTQIWQRHQWKDLYARAMRTLDQGDQLLLVYPLRDKAEVKDEEEGGAKGPPLRNATEVFEGWDKRFPGRVRLLHGQMSDQDKDKALGDMREGKADVLISTTVVEVGVTLPRLRRAIIVHPERHGLTTLHQLRGRLARHGGEGWFDLFLPYPVKEPTMERLNVLVETTDGFAVSDRDMRLRGVGDLSRASEKQTGADDTFLFGRPVRLEILDRALEIVR
jgi:ATP-dependent DNA helicase RecG